MNSFKVLFCLVALVGLCTAELGYFWHFSDTHMQSDYKEGASTKEKDGCYKGKGDAGKFGSYHCRSPYPVELTGTSEMPTLRPDEVPDRDPLFILWTGDSVAKRGGEYSKEVITYDLKNLTDVMVKLYQSFGGKVPLYPVLGNHDAYPQHHQEEKEDWVYKLVADLWKPFLPEDALKTLKEHGYYTISINKKLRLIVLNTVLYYVHNSYTKNIEDPGGQMAWLKKELEKAKQNGEVVYIAGHVPVRGHSGDFQAHFEKPFLKAMEGYHSIIKGSFWGHCHVDTFQLIGDYSTGDFHVGHLASTMGSPNYRNPSFRRYLFDTSKDYDIQDWRTFYMDLEEANKAGKIKWNTLYDAKTAYNISDATPQSILGLIKNMQNDENLFEAVWSKERTGVTHGECDKSCHKKTICTMLHPTESDYNKCLKSGSY